MSKNSAPYFKFFPDDWLSSETVFSMTLEQEGAYIRLLALMWKKGGFLPDNPQWICNGLRCKPAKWKKLRAYFIEKNVFFEQDGSLFNERLTQTLRAFNEKSQKNSDNAKTRWEKEREKSNKNNDSSNANALQTQYHTDTDTDTDTDTKNTYYADSETHQDLTENDNQNKKNNFSDSQESRTQSIGELLGGVMANLGNTEEVKTEEAEKPKKSKSTKKGLDYPEWFDAELRDTLKAIKKTKKHVFNQGAINKAVKAAQECVDAGYFESCYEAANFAINEKNWSGTKWLQWIEESKLLEKPKKQKSDTPKPWQKEITQLKPPFTFQRLEDVVKPPEYQHLQDDYFLERFNTPDKCERAYIASLELESGEALNSFAAPLANQLKMIAKNRYLNFPSELDING